MDIQLFVRSKSDGAVRSYKFPAGPPVVIGRNPEAVVPLEGSALSRDHFSIEYRGGSLYVTDTSSNGTWVNGELVGRGKSKAVGVADLVEVAGYEINYKLAGEPAQSDTKATPPAISPSVRCISRARLAGIPGPGPQIRGTIWKSGKTGGRAHPLCGGFDAHLLLLLIMGVAEGLWQPGTS